MPTPLFMSAGSDETQDLSLWTAFASAGSSVASATDQVYTGARSIKIISANVGDDSQVFTKPGICPSAGAAISFRVRFSTVAPSVKTMVADIYNVAATNTIFGVGLNTNGTLNAGGWGTTTVNGATVLSANTWYRITLAYTIASASSWSVSIYLNGTLEISLSNTNGNLSGTDTDFFNIGTDTAGGSITGYGSTSIITMWFDDIYIDNRTDKSDPGTTDVNSLRITAKRPFANGTTNGFTGQGSASGYGSGNARYVNEQPLSTTNYVSMVGAGSAVTEEYNIESLSAGDIDLTGKAIKGVLGWVYINALAGETAQIIVDGTNSNIAVLTTAPPSTDLVFMKGSATPTVYPAGTGADIGAITSTGLTTVKLYEAGVMVAYSPGSTPTDWMQHSRPDQFPRHTKLSVVPSDIMPGRGPN